MSGYQKKHLDQWSSLGDNVESTLLEVRRESFFKTLKHFVPRTSFRKPKNRATLVLDVGCGQCEEGSVLNAFFGTGIYGKTSQKAKVIGLEKNGEELKRAVDRYQNESASSKLSFAIPTYQFIQADAREMDQISLLPAKLDVILVRHQFSLEDRVLGSRNWHEVLEGCLKKLSPRGLLMITSFCQPENESLLKTLARFSCEVLINEENPYAISLPYEYIEKKIAIDKFVTLVVHTSARNRVLSR